MQSAPSGTEQKRLQARLGTCCAAQLSSAATARGFFPPLLRAWRPRLAWLACMAESAAPSLSMAPVAGEPQKEQGLERWRPPKLAELAPLPLAWGSPGSLLLPLLLLGLPGLALRAGCASAAVLFCFLQKLKPLLWVLLQCGQSGLPLRLLPLPHALLSHVAIISAPREFQKCKKRTKKWLQQCHSHQQTIKVMNAFIGGNHA